MRLEKFYAGSMTEALSKIQDKLGVDAVIYSHTTTEKGIEVVAGIVYQENTASQNQIQEQARQTQENSNLLSRIAEIDQQSLQTELIRIEKINLFQQKLRKLKFPADFIEEYSHTY